MKTPPILFLCGVVAAAASYWALQTPVTDASVAIPTEPPAPSATIDNAGSVTLPGDSRVLIRTSDTKSECAITQRYLAGADGTVTEVSACESESTAEPHPYTGYPDE